MTKKRIKIRQGSFLDWSPALLAVIGCFGFIRVVGIVLEMIYK